MKCQTATKIMQDYLEGRLAVLDRNELVRHVDECSECEAELLSYRDVFSELSRFETREAAPRGFQQPIISQLIADGVIRREHVGFARRLVRGFLALPGLAKYPLAATLAVAALYFPVVAVLGMAPDAVANTTSFFTGVFVIIQDGIAGVGVLASVFEALGNYAKAVGVIFSACASVVSSASNNVLFLAGGFVAALAAIVIVARVAARKRSSHHASTLI